MLKILITKILAIFNLQIRYLNKSHQSDTKYLNFILKKGIKCVIDIGANEGQFASIIRSVLPTCVIHSFEPIPQTFKKLTENFKNDPFYNAYNVACGKDNENIYFNQNDFTPASSFLNLTTLASKEYKNIDRTSKILVKVINLDSYLKKIELQKPYLVKIDTQGSEKNVLHGGEFLIKNAQVLIIELSFKSLYENQPLFGEIYDLLISWGFKYCGNLEQSYSPITGEVLFVDGVFINEQLK